MAKRAVVGFIAAEHNVAVSLDRFKVVQGILLDLLKAPMAERDPFFHHAGTGVEVARIRLAYEVGVQFVVVHCFRPPLIWYMVFQAIKKPEFLGTSSL